MGFLGEGGLEMAAENSWEAIFPTMLYLQHENETTCDALQAEKGSSQRHERARLLRRDG